MEKSNSLGGPSIFWPWGDLKFWGDLQILGGPGKVDDTMYVAWMGN